jgi:hypothetical protein
MIYLNSQGKAELANTPEPVDLVPSKRDATQSLARILASLTNEQCDKLAKDIEIIQKFTWSR